MSAIKIIATPPGEAPQHIREAWMGMVLPLASPAVKSGWAWGVLTSPKTYWAQQLRRLLGQGKRESGYCVEAATAIALLARSSPSAAEWWRESTPHLLNPGRNFIFSVESCEETDAVIWPPPPRPLA